MIKPDLKQTLTMPKKSSARKKSSPASMHFTFEAVEEEDEKPVAGKVRHIFLRLRVTPTPAAYKNLFNRFYQPRSGMVMQNCRSKKERKGLMDFGKL